MARFYGLAVLCAGFAFAFAPSVGSAGESRFEPKITVSEEYTTNVDLGPDDDAQSAFVTRITPGAELRNESSRTETAVDGSLTFRHQTDGDDEGWNLDPRLNGFGDFEILRDLMYLDAKATVSQQRLSNQESNSDANRQTTQVYSLSPSLRSRFGKLAVGEVRYVLDQVWVSDDSVSDETSHRGIATVSSGPKFEMWKWTANGLVSFSDREDSGNIHQKETEFANEYAFSRQFHALGAVGYQTYDDNESVDFQSPTWRAGFRLRPGRRTELEFDYGLRDERYSPRVKFRYNITPRLTFNLSYEEELSTSQQRLTDTLGSIELDPETGELIDNRGDSPFNPRADPLDIDNETERVKAFRAGLRGDYGRNSVALQAGYFDEEKLETAEDQEVYQVDLTGSRKLRRKLTGEVGFGFERIEFEDGRDDDEYLGRVGLRYALGESAGVFGNYLYRQQFSNDSVNEFKEHRVGVGLRVRF